MANYIRACFCIDHPISADQFFGMLQALDHDNCRYNIWTPGEVAGYLLESDQDIGIREPVLDQQTDLRKLHQYAEWLASPGDTNIRFGWNTQGRTYEARIFRNTHGERIRVVFDVEEQAMPLARGTW